MNGENIAQYRVIEKLGAGGMGQIYKAHDTRLNRTVAIKVLPAASSNDPERRKRFLIEAQAASALNHPNIITIHDVLSNGDAECMVMELVEGKTLSDLVPKGGLRVPQALNYMLQMADALVAAHSAGIVHRDLKPANVMVTNAGLVKVLDFGLAKLTERGLGAGLDPNGETSDGGSPTRGLTTEGSILGTLNYMSPEQAEGKKVDTRSDIFSFGAVLYEMLTGVPPFQGESGLSTLSNILRDEVRPLIQVAPDVPVVLDELVRKCLEKNPDERWQSMSDLRTALLSLKRESDSGTLYGVRVYPDAMPSRVAPPPSRVPSPPRSWARFAVAAGVLLVASALTWYVLKPGSANPVAVETGVAPPSAPVPSSPAAKQAEVLTNEGVLNLIEGKVPAEVILSHIQSASATAFDLTTPELIRLTKAGATPALIDQMRDPRKAIPSLPPVAAAKPADKVTAPPQATEIALIDGTPLKITLAEAVPAQANVGMPLRFAVADDLLVQGVVVLPKGTKVSGEITQTPKRGFLGIGDEKMSFALTTAQAAGGATVKVRSVASWRGEGVPERPIQVSGKNRSKEVAADAGTEYLAYIDGAQTVSVRKK